MPKVVICVLPGWAAGGGHSLHVVCDLTLASEEHARFKQTDADVGSFDGGYGSAYLARQVGQKFAREIFFLAQEYSAEDGVRMGTVNKAVPHAELETTALEWGRLINGKSPTAQRMLKYSFNLIDDGLVGQRFGGCDLGAGHRRPAEDHDPALAEQPFLLRARPLAALSQGWLRLAAQGEGLVLLFQSLAIPASGQPSNDLATGLTWLRESDGHLVQERTRLVDGQFRAAPPLWNYDEFRWIDALMRPLLAVDELGNVFVGRAYTQAVLLRSRLELTLGAEQTP